VVITTDKLPVVKITVSISGNHERVYEWLALQSLAVVIMKEFISGKHYSLAVVIMKEFIGGNNKSISGNHERVYQW
jgi:predicted ATP-grasp superfamily ATP-dependent carboligase